MEGDELDGQFELVASGLTRLKKLFTTDEVFTGLRPFPFAKDLSREEIRSITKPIPLADYQKRIAPRLYALEHSEPPPRVMPRVLIEWGLEPHTDPSEIAPTDDRQISPGQPTPIVTNRIPEGQVVTVNEEWFDGEGSIFLIWGILNPNGPTLYCLGEKRIDGKRRVFFRWFHMHGGRTAFAAKSGEQLTYDDLYEGAISIHDHLIATGETGIMTIIPSFLIWDPGHEAIADIAKLLVSKGPAATSNWGRELAYLRIFGINFFGRAGCEIREFYDRKIKDADDHGRSPIH